MQYLLIAEIITELQINNPICQMLSTVTDNNSTSPVLQYKFFCFNTLQYILLSMICVTCSELFMAVHPENFTGSNRIQMFLLKT